MQEAAEFEFGAFTATPVQGHSPQHHGHAEASVRCDSAQVLRRGAQAQDQAPGRGFNFWKLLPARDKPARGGAQPSPSILLCPNKTHSRDS